MNTTICHLYFLGGSVTQGYIPGGNLASPYPTLVTHKLQSIFSDRTFEELNKAQAGTDSMHGLFIAESEVKPALQDYVFIEYAVNNGFTADDIRSYESLIRKLLATGCLPSHLIPIILMREDETNASEYMEAIHSHYNLHSVRIDTILKKHYTWKDFGSDSVHASEYGHQIITETVLSNLIPLIQSSDRDNEILTTTFSSEPFSHHTVESLPSPLYENAPYSNLHVQKFISDTPTVYKYTQKAENLPLKLTLKCSTFCILYHQNNDPAWANITVTVDDRKPVTFNTYSIFAWDNPVTKCIFLDSDASIHSIIIDTASDSKHREVHLCAYGWC